MRFLIFILLFAGVAYSQVPTIEPGVSQELAKWRAAHYSDVRYKLNLTLEKMSPVLKGTMEIRVKLAAQAETRPVGSVPPIILDWRKIRGYEEKSTISNVSINGHAAALENHPVGEAPTPLLRKEGSFGYRESNEHLVFQDGVVAGENVIKLDFTSPILTSGSAITRYVDKEDGSEYIYSLFVPSDASTAFPVFDQPDLKARFQFGAKVPAGWKMVSNSAEEDVHGVQLGPDGKTAWETFLFEETQPISTYVFAFAVGDFKEFFGEITSTDSARRPDIKRDGLAERALPLSRGSATHIYIRKSQAEKFKPHAAEVFRLNREAVKYFEQYFDYKFPFPKYDLVLIPEFPFGGMEHAGATFLRESSVIFPQEPTKNDYISRATVIFHETAHQWFGDTVTMRWFDDLWLKEGFATFMAYKAMEKIMPDANAWKVFYERVKQGAYQTDSTKGTTPIYQEIKNLSAAKSAYGNIVYNKAPAFLRQAEFYLGEDNFQTAVRAFLKKHEYANAGWEDLVKEFETASRYDLKSWSRAWVMSRGLAKLGWNGEEPLHQGSFVIEAAQTNVLGDETKWESLTNFLVVNQDGTRETFPVLIRGTGKYNIYSEPKYLKLNPRLIFPNYGDYGYGIFLLDDKSRNYVLKNIQNEKDPFLRSMMWGSLWDSVREGELDPRAYVELVVKVLSKSYAFTREEKGITPKGVTLTEDESTMALLLNQVGTAMNYYIDAPMQKPDREGGRNTQRPDYALADARASASGDDLRTRVENLLIERMQNAETLGQRITYYRAFLNVAASENARTALKKMLTTETQRRREDIPLKTKDKFDIVTRLLILGDPDAPRLLADLEKTETGDDAKRYAYAAKAGIPTAENKAKYWNDFTNNKEISESWIEAAFGPWNSIRQSDLTLPYLQKALQELPNHKRNRKIFFVNGWLGAFIGGQRSEEALNIVNKFLADNPNLDRDLRLKILENVDLIERAVKIRAKYGKN